MIGREHPAVKSSFILFVCLLNLRVIRFCLHLSGLLYAVNPAELEEKYDSISNSSTVAAFPAVQEQFRKYWAIKEDWTIGLRQDRSMPRRGSNTDNIVEVSFRTLKDKILKRQKCYNLVQLPSYTAVFISKFFCRKLLQRISIPGTAGAFSASKKSETRGSQIAKEHIVRIEGDTFKVSIIIWIPRLAHARAILAQLVQHASTSLVLNIIAMPTMLQVCL